MKVSELKIALVTHDIWSGVQQMEWPPRDFQEQTYQNATIACEATCSEPATMVLVSGLQATERTGLCLARVDLGISPSAYYKSKPVSYGKTGLGYPCMMAQKFSDAR